ncbi:sulfotransferase family 2 domain-containing protein [Oceanidesulfovibrio marinus]|uniref:Sulfotransferase family protein n=1 Tax=Oceanidesulfovibrio marinus TaxID=370038 RepID=A0ABX6NGU7_9BACT|nr:sulfotransferase family 2 domain-containing protein [Oceanidesulfovibrio marinus]QJT09278.1 sulfotransferase family protein [Oceanidesulfovibrio marinus]
MRDRLIFQHIPKTAGSTARAGFAALYPSQSVFAFDQDGVLDNLLTLPREKKDAIRFFSGHVDYGIHKIFNGPTVYAAFLRDPVERVFSHWWHIFTRPEHRFHDFAQSTTLDEFLDAAVRPRMNNCMTRMLSGINPPYGECPESMLKAATRNISESYCFLGTKERFEESYAMLAQMLGADEKQLTPPPSRNLSENRPRVEELPRETRRCIERLNGLDIELYEKFKPRLPMVLTPKVTTG